MYIKDEEILLLQEKLENKNVCKNDILQEKIYAKRHKAETKEFYYYW